MGFQFRFQKILDLKEKEKEQLQQSLSSSLKKLESEKEIHSDLLSQKAKLEDNLLRKQEERVFISDLLQIHSFQQRLVGHIVQSQERLTKSEKDVERKMTQVTEKVKEEKSWQFLKTREWTKFKQEEDKKEQALLDEISIGLHIKNSNNFE